MNEINSLAVLVSGGLDSAVLLAESLFNYSRVYPLYVREGLAWEAVELEYLRRFLEAIQRPALQSLHVLEVPVTDLYRGHWSVSGIEVPGADTPDEAVFLPGRNVLFLAKAMLWCHLNAVEAVALAVLARNPFPDATPEFFSSFPEVVNRAVGGKVRVLRPYAELSKEDVLRRGREAPLALTFSCIQPRGGLHCGTCNKCAERRAAFISAVITDPTIYSTLNRVL
jgi:7-cyano-7-deazaguanine synthase